MKMDKLKLYGCMGILAMAFTMSACSSDDENADTPQSGVNWTTNGGLKACDHLLFTADGDANVNDNGTQIGNGDQEFVFTGKQTLKKVHIFLKVGFTSLTELSLL